MSRGAQEMQNVLVVGYAAPMAVDVLVLHQIQHVLIEGERTVLERPFLPGITAIIGTD